jgi:hypothetical protein
MKDLKQIIQEKLKITKDSKINNYDDILVSHTTNNPHKFENVNWIVSSGTFKPMRFNILIEYADEILKSDLLKNKKDIDFCKEWLQRAKKAYRNNKVSGLGWNSEQAEFTWLCNGEEPTFGNAKFTYDLIQYGLSQDDITTPRKKRLEKMIRDFWYKVNEHKNEMNWY